MEDGVCTSLELLPILPKEQTAELLAAELEKRGFEREGAVARRTEPDGVHIEIDVSTGAVSVKAEASSAIAIEKERTERIYEETLEAGTQAARKRVADEAEVEALAAEQRAQREVSEKLAVRLRDLRRELDAVTNRVTAEALKAKARTLGEIEELQENAETGELTIKVRL